MSEIFVAVQDIDIGEKFTAENIKLEPWPLDRIPTGAIRKLEDVEGMFSNQRLYAGEPLITRKVSSSAGNSRRDIPRDFSVVSMQTDPASSVATLVQPGDLVNVIGFFKKSEVIPQTMTQKILMGIRVYAVDGRKTREDAEEVGTPAKSISLLIHRKDEEVWAYANELGNVRLSLCHPDEYDDSADSLGPDEAGQEFLKWIAEYSKKEADAKTTEPAEVVSFPSTPEPKGDEPFRMTKITGNKMQQYELRDGIWMLVQSSDESDPVDVAVEEAPPEVPANDYSYLNGSDSPFFTNQEEGAENDHPEERREPSSPAVFTP